MVQAVVEAAVGVHGLDLFPSLEAGFCAVQSASLFIRVYFEHFEALKRALQLLPVDVSDAVWCARILDKITPVGVAVLVDAIEAQNVYSAVVKRNELRLTAAARA